MAFYEAVGAVPSVKVGFLIVFFRMATGKKQSGLPRAVLQWTHGNRGESVLAFVLSVIGRTPDYQMTNVSCCCAILGCVG